MNRRFGTLVSLTAATLLVAGCGLFSKPTGPSSDNDEPTSGLGFFGRIGGESAYQFELGAPTYTWQVNWYDEYMAVGGLIGGAETVSQTFFDAWEFTSTHSYAWDWDGYTDLEPDGVIVTTYPHNFLSAAETADGTINVDVMKLAESGTLYGTVTGGTVEELLTTHPGPYILDLVTGLTTPAGMALDTTGTGKMYWTDDGTNNIQRANLDGTGSEELVTGLNNPMDIALDVSGGKMYWADKGKNEKWIRRANLDGSSVETIVSGQNQPVAVALDVAGGKMYWADDGNNNIRRANLDGSGSEELVTGLNKPLGIAVDPAGGKMYWTDDGNDTISRANLDGTSAEVLVTGVLEPLGIDLDVSGGKMYWADGGKGGMKISRANLDGTTVEDLVTGLSDPYGIALDLEAGHIYLTEQVLDKISRTTNIDGSNDGWWAQRQYVTFDITGGTGAMEGYTGTGTAEYVFDYQTDDMIQNTISMNLPDVAVSKIYWADKGVLADWISRANLYNGEFTENVVIGLSNPTDVALDTTGGGKIYWTDDGTNNIQRSNLDGTGIEELVTGLNNPMSIALDVSGGKMYWGDKGKNEQWIRRANLDGSSVETIVSGQNKPVYVAIDDLGGKLYWVDEGTKDVRRSNLDGSSVEILVTGLNKPVSIALDPLGGKMYWTDKGNQNIRRANLDGSGSEVLVASLNNPAGIVLDPDAGKMYWASSGDLKIKMANLDGTSVADLITTGLVQPTGLAIHLKY